MRNPNFTLSTHPDTPTSAADQLVFSSFLPSFLCMGNLDGFRAPTCHAVAFLLCSVPHGICHGLAPSLDCCSISCQGWHCLLGWCQRCMGQCSQTIQFPLPLLTFSCGCPFLRLYLAPISMRFTQWCLSYNDDQCECTPWYSFKSLPCFAGGGLGTTHARQHFVQNSNGFKLQSSEP